MKMIRNEKMRRMRRIGGLKKSPKEVLRRTI